MPGRDHRDPHSLSMSKYRNGINLDDEVGRIIQVLVHESLESLCIVCRGCGRRRWYVGVSDCLSSFRGGAWVMVP